MAEKDPNSPATTSTAYDCMLPRWELMNALLGGTEAMREAGETYLPKHTEETDLNYQARLQGSVLFNMVEQTLDTLAGKPFKEPIHLNEDVPAQLQEDILLDVDLQGNNLDVFARQWFREGMSKAFAHVLIDFPKIEPKTDNKPRTLDDDRKEGVRPYWVLIKPECIIDAYSEVINGVETLLHIRILEAYTERNGFAEVVKERIKVLEPGTVEVYELKKVKGQKEQWVSVDKWVTGLSYIPLVTFYANREGFMRGKSPLQDLAHLNVTHWQSTAEQRHVLSVSRFPVLACSGAAKDDSDPIVIGPNQVLYNEDPQGKFYYVEYGGAGVDSGWKDLEQLENKMAGYGAEFLKKKPGTQTATARALDSAEASSDLSAMSVVFEDAVAQALDITADWLKLGKAGGTVEVVKEYDMEEEDPAAIEFLKYLREKRDISRKALLEIAVTKGLLPEDFDAEEDMEEILDEVDQLMKLGGSLVDLDPGANDPDDDDEDGKKSSEKKTKKKAPAKGKE